MNRPKVLFFSRDPGATNQLVAVHELLCLQNDSTIPAIATLQKTLNITHGETPQAVIIGKQYAHDVWRTAGIEAEDGANASPQQFIDTHKPSLVVTGTDDIDEPDTTQLWQAAIQANIPVAVFLDNLVNLEARFRARDDELITPDMVFTLDHHSTDSLVAVGIPKHNLHTTENLHLARLARVAKNNQDARDAIRKSWQASDQITVILFASENTTEMAALGRPAPYDEHAVLKSLIEDTAHGRSIGDADIDPEKTMIVIRPHPRDAAGKYDSYTQNAAPAVNISTDGTPLEAIMAADLVAGMDSALLFEAQALGRPAVSLVSNSKFNEFFT